MEFSERLKALRLRRGLTQEQLAHALDIPETSVRRWESVGKPPKRERLEKLADFFGVSVDFLLGRTDTPNRKKITYEDLDDDERKIVEQVREVATEYGYELSDPEFLKIFRAAIEFAKRVRGPEDQDNHSPK
jgi:transcriptional regulator with XRE-family HTH domain